MIVNTFRILIVHAHAAETIHHSEVSLKMVAPGAGFRSGTFYRPKNKWRPKKNELVFSPKVCDDQKKGLCRPIRGFSVSKEKNNKWCHPKLVTPAPLATPLPPLSALFRFQTTVFLDPLHFYQKNRIPEWLFICPSIWPHKCLRYQWSLCPLPICSASILYQFLFFFLLASRRSTFF